MGTVLTGRLRDSDKGRGWRAKLYSPTEKYPYWRASFKDPQTGQWVTPQVPSGQDSEDWFRTIEAALDHQVVIVSLRSPERPTMRMLFDRYLEWLRAGNRDDGYIDTVTNILDVWVLRKHGELHVDSWTPVHSQEWIAAARDAGLSPARVENLGTALSGMRKAAWRKGKDNVRWLDRSEDPLEDVDYSRRTTEEGAHRDYVRPTERPITAQVESLLAAAEEESPWPWMTTQIRVGAYCGPRLGEQMALRAVDVDFAARNLQIRNSMRWPRPSKDIEWGMKATKTGRRRTTPYPASLHEPLLALCRARLGLPEDASIEDVAAAQAVHYEVLRDLDAENLKPGRKPRSISLVEGLLFVDSNGLPPTKEKYGDAWREVRSRSTWPVRLPWLNARHHCATWWPKVKGEASVGDEDFAKWLGHSLQTYTNHYRVSGEDSQETARCFLDQC